VVPQWYSEQRLKDRYPIPEAEKSFVKTQDFEVPAPPDPGVVAMKEAFEIKSSQGDTWLLANEPPGKIWPALKTYWETFGGQVNEVDPSTGIMGVTLPSNSLKASQFIAANKLNSFAKTVEIKLLVEQGLKRQSSEIRIRSIGGQQVGVATEEQLLNEISVFLESAGDRFESYSLAAQNIGNRDKVKLVNEPGKLYINVELGFERAWHAVGEALQRGNIPVIDWNRNAGVYYVSFIRQDKDKSWLARVFDFGDEERLSDEFNYEVQLKDSVDGVQVVSVPVSGVANEPETIRLLNQLLDHMS